MSENTMEDWQVTDNTTFLLLISQGAARHDGFANHNV